MVNDGDLFYCKKVIDEVIFESFIGHKLWNVSDIETLHSSSSCPMIRILLVNLVSLTLALFPNQKTSVNRVLYEVK